MELVIGNKNYSSWSMRPWMLLTVNGMEFKERRLPLFTAHFYQQIAQYSPAGTVPALHDGDIKVWDSLAICEYINEQYLQGKAWPKDPSQRAKARAVSCQMHSGFNAIRNELPMNCRALRRVTKSEALEKDITRLQALWEALLAEHAGPWLFGEFSIADAMYAPVASRFHTYGIELSSQCQGYVDHWLTHPAMQSWYRAAHQETEIVEEDEAGEPR